jgi:peroxiredoxin
VLKNFSFIFFFLCAFSGLAQNAQLIIKLEQIPNGVNSDYLIISSYYSEQYHVVYRQEIKNDSIQTFDITLTEPIKSGLFQIYIEDNSEKETNKAEVILNPSEKPVFDAFYFQLKNGSLSVSNSIENQAYTDLLALKEYYEPQILELSEKREFISVYDASFKQKSLEIELNTELLQSKFDQELLALEKFYPGTYTTRVMLPLTLIPVRSSSLEWSSNYDSYLSFLHRNYFYFVDFNNPEILSHYAFADKLFYYFNDYTEKNAVGAEKGIDIIMGNRKDNNEVNSFLYNYLLRTFLKLDSESLTKYLVDNYSSSCSLDLPFEELKKLQTIQALSVGGIAPEISLPDQNSKYNSLREYCSKNEYTILFVWLSWCSRCQKEIPELSSIYLKYKSKGLGVYTVSLDEKKSEWESKLISVNRNWINVSELVSIPNSSVVKSYNITTTPVIYVLDKSGKVMSKNLYGDQLDQFLKKTFED